MNDRIPPEKANRKQDAVGVGRATSRAGASSHAPLAVYLDLGDLDPAPGVARLRAAGFEVVCAERSELGEHPAAEGLLVGYDRIDATALDLLPRLGVIATHSAGVDMVDLDACASRGLWVCNVVDAATEEVAAHALALVLSLLRSIPRHDRAVRSGGWEPLESVTLRRPSTLTCGVIGVGRIGRRFVELASPLFGRVVATDPEVPAASWPSSVQRLGLEELLECSDVVSLHLPLTVETRGLIGASALARMPAGSYLVNVSRGAIVDTDALEQALRSGRLAGAGLDVLSEEPPAAPFGLGELDTVVLTPHIGYLSVESAADYISRPAENLIAWSRGERPPNVVLAGTRSVAHSAP